MDTKTLRPLSLLLLTFALIGCMSNKPHESIAKVPVQRVKSTSFKLQALYAEDVYDKVNRGMVPFSDPEDPDIYVWIYDTELNVIAHPDPMRLGQNDFKLVDDKGKAYGKQIYDIATARKLDRKGWVYYVENGQSKAAYTELVQQRDGEWVIVTCTTNNVAPPGGFGESEAPKPAAKAPVATTAKPQPRQQAPVAAAPATTTTTAAAATTTPSKANARPTRLGSPTGPLKDPTDVREAKRTEGTSGEARSLTDRLFPGFF